MAYNLQLFRLRSSIYAAFKTYGVLDSLDAVYNLIYIKIVVLAQTACCYAVDAGISANLMIQPRLPDRTLFVG